MTSVLSCVVATIALAADPGLKGLPLSRACRYTSTFTAKVLATFSGNRGVSRDGLARAHSGAYDFG